MKILFYFGHPAHYHFYIPVIRILIKLNYQIKIVIKAKDIELVERITAEVQDELGEDVTVISSEVISLS